jgi:hypothetical protein
MAGGKIRYDWRKNPHSGGKFQAMLCDNFPGKFRRRQVVVLRHTLSGLEISGIFFAVYLPILKLLYSATHLSSLSPKPSHAA